VPDPSPSSPLQFDPQQDIEPATVRPQEWYPPETNWVNRPPPVTAVGVETCVTAIGEETTDDPIPV
jgi:hypothetical protein